MATMYEFWGRHSFCNMEGIDSTCINDPDYFIALLHAAIATTNATLVDMVCHNFIPEGLSVIAVLRESHVAIHTYPEFHALFLDVFTCGKKADPEKVVSYIINELKPKQHYTQTIIRSSPTIKEKSF